MTCNYEWNVGKSDCGLFQTFIAKFVCRKRIKPRTISHLALKWDFLNRRHNYLSSVAYGV
jgi:hypothetical protein